MRGPLVRARAAGPGVKFGTGPRGQVSVLVVLGWCPVVRAGRQPAPGAAIWWCCLVLSCW